MQGHLGTEVQRADGLSQEVARLRASALSTPQRPQGQLCHLIFLDSAVACSVPLMPLFILQSLMDCKAETQRLWQDRLLPAAVSGAPACKQWQTSAHGACTDSAGPSA